MAEGTGAGAESSEAQKDERASRVRRVVLCEGERNEGAAGAGVARD